MQGGPALRSGRLTVARMGRRTSRAAGFGWIVVSYAVATTAALLLATRSGARLPAWQALALGDGAATLVVFGFSVLLDNSSVYDPYWSVAPMVIATALVGIDAERQALGARQVVVLALVLVWGARLTYNWARGWGGLGHEDWRYVEYRRAGRSYWVVSLLGFHLMPTIWVYLGCLSLLAVFSSARGPALLDGLALVVTVAAIALETIADEQLRDFRRAHPTPGAVLDTGVWAHSRHPNYLGELGFWWGLYLFGLAADPSMWWAIVGPVSITLLFVFVSVPLLDRRSVARRPGYARHMALVPALVPRLFGRRTNEDLLR
jgi:steroid 5-alpha reductase family enzyme